MTYKPRTIANAFLLKAKQSGMKLTHLKIQKLVFFLHAWHLAKVGEPLVNENPKAWSYGPVFETLYHELKTYGNQPVDGYLTEYDEASASLKAFLPAKDETSFWGLLDDVWKVYGNRSAGQLSAITHKKGSPWDDTLLNEPIEPQMVIDYYRPRLTNEHTAAR